MTPLSFPSEQSAVEFEQVSFRFRPDSSWVLSDVSWKIPLKTWCSILGPNGVGKSTVLKLIAGELFPVQGDVRCQVDRSKLAYVPQYSPFLNINALVQDVVMTLRRALPQHTWISPQRWESIFGVAEIWKQDVSTLSAGQRQRLVIGLYLLKPVEIILLDEPTSGCDVHNANMICDLLESIRKELGITIIHVSHEIHQVLSYAKEVICMGGGSHIHRHIGALTHSELEQAYGCELKRLVQVHGEHSESSS